MLRPACLGLSPVRRLFNLAPIWNWWMLADNFKTSQREGDERLCKKRGKKDRKQNPTKRKWVKSSTLWGRSCKLALTWHDGNNGLRRDEISFRLPGMGLCGWDVCDLASRRQLGLTQRDEQLLGHLSSQVAPSIIARWRARQQA